MAKPDCYAKKESAPSFKEMISGGSKLRAGEEMMPSDVAIQVRCRKETAKKYEKKIQAFLSDVLKREKLSKVQFIILEDKDDEESHFFFNEGITAFQNGDSQQQKLPSYDQSFDEPLGCDLDNSEVQDENQAQARKCFNCLGNHHLKDCPQKHDGYRIASNKRNLMETPTIRYHKDDAQLMEKSNIRPGHISDTLRTALNLKPNQLPTYIYTMRILGYPPGWMKEAEIESSGLTVYDSNGNATSDDREEKIDKNSESCPKVQYDGKKFIAFPGFNTPVPDGVIDEYKQLRMPPLQKHQLLSEALKHKMVLISPECKKKRKTNDCINHAKKTENSCSDVSIPKTPDKNSQVQNQEDSSNKRKNSNTVISGSPLINQKNPYKKLPDSNKFAEGMSEYLPYENLPDAVGAFDKMRGVLDDVRVKLSKH